MRKLQHIEIIKNTSEKIPSWILNNLIEGKLYKCLYKCKYCTCIVQLIKKWPYTIVVHPLWERLKDISEIDSNIQLKFNIRNYYPSYRTDNCVLKMPYVFLEKLSTSELLEL